MSRASFLRVLPKCGDLVASLLTNCLKNIDGQTIRWSHILKHSPNTKIDKSVWARYKNLKYAGKSIQATYLWVDGSGENVRLKDRILPKPVTEPCELPEWTYDGSSCYQAEGDDSDLILMPQALYRDPFKPGKKDVIVLCDSYTHDGKPAKGNHRVTCAEAMEQAKDTEPWFGFEQEYTLLDFDRRPFGWPEAGTPEPQGPYYCAVGANRVFGRDLAEAHVIACLYAGVQICGTNAEVMPSQWEYQVGPGLGMKAADDLWVARYILGRIAEEMGIVVTIDPKPMQGDWNGAGGHTNFSTKEMREEGGIDAINEAIEKLSHKHKEHLAVYDPKGGEDNRRRLVGRLETSSMDKFSSGVANRAASVRIPRNVAAEGRGYLEDRRPSANANPYQVCNALVRTIILDEK